MLAVKYITPINVGDIRLVLFSAAATQTFTWPCIKRLRIKTRTVMCIGTAGAVTPISWFISIRFVIE